MHTPLKSWLASLSMALGGLVEAAPASSIQRCEGPDGQITFTSLSCPAGDTATTQPLYNNAVPRGALPGRAPTRSGEKPLPTTGKPKEEPLLIVGERDDGCGNRLSRPERRQAIIARKVLPGMSRRDIESAFGRPDKITQTISETRYLYSEKNRTTRVDFDSDDCVKAKR